MEEWAAMAFGGKDDEVIESLFEFCGVYPSSGLPDVLGKRVEKRVERLMEEKREKEAQMMIKRVFEAPWAQESKVW
jgi:hypothetical protein